MDFEQFHRYIKNNTGNESNVCQIYAIKDGKEAFNGCWRGFKTDDAMNINSVTKPCGFYREEVASPNTHCVNKGYVLPYTQ